MSKLFFVLLYIQVRQERYLEFFVAFFIGVVAVVCKYVVVGVGVGVVLVLVLVGVGVGGVLVLVFVGGDLIELVLFGMSCGCWAKLVCWLLVVWANFVE